MLLESETDLTLAFGLAAVLFLGLTVLLAFLWLKARGELAHANELLGRTEVGADRTERRMFQILQAIPVALVETDLAGKFVFANRAAHQLLGRKDAELIGLRFHSATWGITYPDGRQIPPDLLPAARALRGQTVKGFQHLMVNPATRKKMLVSVTAMPILNEAGEVIGSSSAIVETESLSTPQPEPEDEIRSRYFDIAGVMLLALGRDGRIRDINPYGAEILGVPVEDAIGRDWLGEILPEEDRTEGRAYFTEVIEGRREMPATGEGWIVRPDGERRLISWRGSVLRDARDRIVATLSSGEDVTEMRAADQRAADAKESLRLATEAGAIASWSVNTVTGEVQNSASMAKVWGLAAANREDVDRQLAMIHPDDRPQVDEALRQVRETGAAYHAEFRVVQPDARVIWLVGHGEPIRGEDDAIQGIRGVNYDITALKTAQAAVKESEDRFGNLADVAPVVIWLTDANGDRTWVNRPWLDLTGLSLEQALGWGWLQSVHPEDRARVEAAYRAAMDARTPLELEYRLLRHDGVARWFRFTGKPRAGADGAQAGFIGGGSDITEMVQGREELERRVAARTAELERSQEAQRKTEAALAQAQRLETVGRLTGGVAHDFNNLLTVVIGALDMIVRQADSAERVKRLGEAALAASRRGERLTRQLLAFSRRQEFKLEKLDLTAVVRGFESMLRRGADESIPLTVEVADGIGVANLDPIQLEAALLNLVVNAKDAIDGGAGAITVRADRVRLGDGQIAEVEAGDYARLAVIDTGAGMAPEVAARALEPFFTTKEVGKGTGLGLAQVYGFAKQSGGGVEIDTAPGAGTTVALYLPIVEEEADGQRETAELTGEAIEKDCLVLLVEDDLGVRTVAENLLLELGCRVITAENGPEALATLERTPDVGLLLTDVVMPGGMSGPELARAVKAQRPDLKILLSTGYAGDEAEAAESHGWPVLRKPYQARELAEALRAALA